MKKWQKNLVLIGSAVLAVLIVAGGFAWYTVNHYLNKVNKIDEDDIEIIQPGEDEDDLDEEEEELTESDGDETASDGGETSSDGGETSSDASETKSDASEKQQDPVVVFPEIEPIDDDKLINILLVGQDKRSNETTRQRSDSMILLSINPDTGEMAIISFLRDSYVQIPGGYKPNRLNVAYRFGGFNLLYKTLKKNFGISVDYGVEVDFAGFEKIIDILGGVDVELTQKEADHLLSWAGVEGLTEGVNTLDGYAALMFARIRVLDSEIKRSGRQRKILLSVYNKFRSSDLSTLMTLLDDALPYFSTTMTNAEMISVLTTVFPHLADIDLESYVIPQAGAYEYMTIRKMAVTVPDLEKCREALLEYLPLD